MKKLCRMVMWLTKTPELVFGNQLAFRFKKMVLLPFTYKLNFHICGYRRVSGKFFDGKFFAKKLFFQETCLLHL